ncbi:winged helix-turn-helix domain-containing protein [Rheinheimera baltica]|uniref:winged helix-turn-helix domain-containing protein n=1 Tax=Rheinheimera baltica TaxID=67576 RepID=UPI00273D0416|nr:winged helix-turn-helix domain-containing protein [Rheinheimera baltica]MDP5151798.1 winged helix-turn-helix domain-containing protein [Rheinheimera baltica]
MSNLDPLVQIGDWYYQVVYGELWPITIAKPESPLRLEPRLHSLLNFFLRHPNTLLAKDTLIDKVWPTEEGTDAAVMRAVGALRKVLGDDVRSPIYIATVSKKGYCWLAEIKPVEQLAPCLEADDTASVSTTSSPALLGDKKLAWSWRAINLTAGAVLLCCASLAYVLAKYTAEPLVRLPDIITPISALSGEEYWPLVNSSASHVVYQYKGPQQPWLNWSIQSLADLKVEHLPQQYLALSQPVWFDEQELLFRARSQSDSCAFYRQQLLPTAGPAQLLQQWPCYQVLTQALVRWHEQWLWADIEPETADILLFASPLQATAKQVNRISHNWRQLNGLLLSDNTLYLLVQLGGNSSAVYRLSLPDGQPERIIAFPYLVKEFSWWSKDQLLLSAVGSELEILDLNSMAMQRLGPLTVSLAQASRVPGKVLATQYLDYTTDIYHFAAEEQQQQVSLHLTPWHVSNRSERLLAVSEYGTAFVSDRTGHAQVWLAQGKNSTQLTWLTEQQQVQQLLWHKGELLLVINNQLFQLNLQSSELTLYPGDISSQGRFSSCDNRLYWTALTNAGWQLFTETDKGHHLVQQDVVDVRCAPGTGVVIQLPGQNQLALLQEERRVDLPVELNWRQLSPEQWFVDTSGIYWLEPNRAGLGAYLWNKQEVNVSPWLSQQWPEAIYSNGRGIGYVVQSRPYDTDIVWLQNRR